MAHKNLEPTLTTGNVVFLYGLLKDSIGLGRQTFLTHVEAALEEQRMTADDLGFPSTQALLEALGDCVKLTIFKGGRVYATIIEQPEWDAALAAAAKGAKQAAPAKGNKPWKRKKGDKAIKPVRPKRVKREPDPEPVVAQPEPDAAADGDPAAGAGAGAAALDTPPAIEREHAKADATPAAELAASEPDDDAQSPAGEPELPEERHEEEPGVEEEPSIAVTVTYDPYTGIEEETVIKATPGAFVPAQEDVFIGQRAACAAPQKRAREDVRPPQEAVRTDEERPAPKAAPAPEPAPKAEPAPEPVAAPAAAHRQATPPAPVRQAEAIAGPRAAPAIEAAATAQAAPAKPALPEDLPVDFATDVYCPGALLHRLTMLYPYGADVLGILTEYFHIACDAGTVRANRRRASFPARYLQDRERKTVLVRLIRRDADAQGAGWVIEAVEDDEPRG